MKTLSRISLIAFLGIACAFAQTVTPSTTTCAAVSASATTICLTSIASVAAGQTYLYLDSELMQTIGTPSNAAAVKVARGIGAQSGPQSHASGAQVWIGLTPAFSVAPGTNGFSLRANLAQPSGTCVRTAQAYLPVIYPGIGQKFDCDALTGVWRPYLIAGPPAFVTAAGANNAITSPVGSQPPYVGLIVSVTLANSLQAGANTFAYAGGAALAVKSHLNPASNLAAAYVATGVANLQLANIAGTLTWLDLGQ